MPDRYIIHRQRYAKGAARAWSKEYNKLSEGTRDEFLDALQSIHRSRERQAELQRHRRFSKLLDHYYPGGRTPHDEHDEQEAETRPRPRPKRSQAAVSSAALPLPTVR